MIELRMLRNILNFKIKKQIEFDIRIQYIIYQNVSYTLYVMQYAFAILFQ